MVFWKIYDVLGQLVFISQELLWKEWSLNELWVLLLEVNCYFLGLERDLSCEVYKVEWWIKEQKFKDDIWGLCEKLIGLDKEKLLLDQRCYFFIDLFLVFEFLWLQY